MPETPQLGLIEIALIAASCGAWCWLVLRWRHGKEPLPQEPCSEVRWDFMDVLFVAMVYFTLLSSALVWFPENAPSEQSQPVVTNGEESSSETADEQSKSNSTTKTSQHPVVQLLVRDSSAQTFILLFLVAGVSAPLFEEFFFRLMLLGWMAKREKALWRLATVRGLTGAFPLVLTSLAFALMHFRSAAEPMEPADLIHKLRITGITNIAALGVSLAYLRTRYGRAVTDFGTTSRLFVKDLKTAAITFFLVAVPVLFLNFLLQKLVPSNYALDPIPLFLFALVLGWLYLRTGRLTSSVLLHFFLNAFSLLVLLALARSGGAAGL